jgi:hypothetical protein
MEQPEAAIQPAVPASTPITSSIGIYIEQGLDFARVCGNGGTLAPDTTT